eukprot:3760137-Rhodomonas_salina.1
MSQRLARSPLLLARLPASQLPGHKSCSRSSQDEQVACTSPTTRPASPLPHGQTCSHSEVKMSQRLALPQPRRYSRQHPRSLVADLVVTQ